MVPSHYGDVNLDTYLDRWNSKLLELPAKLVRKLVSGSSKLVPMGTQSLSMEILW